MASSTTTSFKTDAIRMSKNCSNSHLKPMCFSSVETDKMKFHTEMVNGKPQIFFDTIGSSSIERHVFV